MRTIILASVLTLLTLGRAEARGITTDTRGATDLLGRAVARLAHEARAAKLDPQTHRALLRALKELDEGIAMLGPRDDPAFRLRLHLVGCSVQEVRAARDALDLHVDGVDWALRRVQEIMTSFRLAAGAPASAAAAFTAEDDERLNELARRARSLADALPPETPSSFVSAARTLGRSFGVRPLERLNMTGHVVEEIVGTWRVIETPGPIGELVVQVEQAYLGAIDALRATEGIEDIVWLPVTAVVELGDAEVVRARRWLREELRFPR
jgi:hypothetical protein